MQFNPATIVFLLPSLITLVVLRSRGTPWQKTLAVLGWRLGKPIHYLWASLFCLVAAPLTIILALVVVPDLYRHPTPGTTLYYYAHLGLSVPSILSAFLNETFFTALGEEAFFRGLLGGWLMRRFGFLVGNALQTLIFLLPHLPILFVAASFWPLLAFPLLLGWVNGWLRYKSDSIFPGMLIHAVGNTISDALAMVMI
jgi:membrane protease YdiL (CAAX protease family)